MKIYVSKDGKQYGPYTVKQLREYVRQGNFTTADHACYDGQNWVTIAQVPGFAAGGDSVTTPQQHQAVPEDALKSLPKKKKIILCASVGAIAALLVTGLLIWLLADDESNQTTAETPPVKSPEVAKVVVDGDKIEEREDLYYFEGKLFTGLAVDKYENGQKKYEATYKDGKEDGLSTSWYENGQKSWEGTFKDGEEISTKEWDEDGNPLGQDQGGEAPKSVVDATKVVVDADHLEERDDLFYFKGEPFTGCAVAEADNGQSETTYKDGKKHGLEFWYENGQKAEEGTWKDGKKHGLSTSWQEDGQKSSECTYKDGERDGLWTQWYDNGQKRFEKTYKDGKMISYKEWDEDGTPLGQDQEVGATKPAVEAAKVVVDDGKLEVRGGFYYFKGALFTGVTVAKGPNGKKSSETTFKDGNIDGLVTEWDENGQKKSEFIYSKDGKRNGLETQWYDNGQKEFEVTYKDDKEDGLWTSWYENGQMAEEGTSKDGNLVSATAWKPNGEKCPDTNLVDGNGITCYYHDNGQKSWEGTYKDGELVKTK